MNLRIHGLGEAQEIGVGGSATVYRARRESDGRAVAVKVLNQTDPRFVERFQRERDVLTSLSRSPRIVTVHDAGTTEAGRPYLVLELCRSSLLDQINDRGPIEPREACRLLAGITEAVADAHLIGVVHRDLKPANVLVSMSGEYLVADFGISTVVGSTTTETTTMAFTAGYVAPETLAGNQAGPAADVYALGATLFHLITGSAPFTSTDGETNIFAVANRVANEPVPDLRGDGVPDDVCQLMEAALAKDPTERPSAAKLRGLLDRAADGPPETGLTSDPLAGPTSRPRPPLSPLTAALRVPPDLPRYRDLEFAGRVEGASVFTGFDGDQPAGDNGEGSNGRAVSVRVLDVREFDPEQRKTFRAERAALQSVSAHPRLAPLSDHGFTTDGRPFDVTGASSDSTMERVVAEGGPLPWPRVVEVGIMVASALEVLHRQGFTHGNVVPSSLITLDDGEVVLADYGAAAPTLDGTDSDPRRRSDDLRSLGLTMLALAGVEPPTAREPVVAPDWSAAIAASEGLRDGPVSLRRLLDALARFDGGADAHLESAYDVIGVLHDLQVGLGIDPTPPLVDPPDVAPSEPGDWQDAVELVDRERRDADAGSGGVDPRWPPPRLDPGPAATATTELSRLDTSARSPSGDIAEQAAATGDLGEAIGAATGDLSEAIGAATGVTDGEGVDDEDARRVSALVSAHAVGGPGPGASALASGYAVADRHPQPPVAPVAPVGREQPRLTIRSVELVDRVEARVRSMIGLLGGVLAGLVLLGGIYVALQRQSSGQGTDTAATGAATSTSAVVAAIVPVIADIDEAAATARIGNAGFEVEVTRVFDPDVPRGEVVSSTPPSGSSAELGTVVSLVVSRGSEPRCIGSTEQGVRHQLEDRNLALAGVTRSHSETIQAGLVIRCVIYDDTDTAIIVVSNGPRESEDG